MFVIEFTTSAREDLRFLRKFDQAIVVDAIDQHLVFEPLQETRNKKLLNANELARWELRAQQFRVFYDIESDAVVIKAVGWKEHQKLFIRGKEFLL